MRRRTWTDDDLIAALDGSSTMAEVVHHLRLAKGGASYTTVRTRMEQLDLEPPAPPRGTSPAGQRPWRRTFSDAELEHAVATARSLKAVFDALDLQVGGEQWLTVRQLILDRGWSTAHWQHPLGRARPRNGETQRFREALASADLPSLARGCRSRADLIRSLGCTPAPGLYRILREVLATTDLDLSHFEPSYARMVASPPRPREPLEALLVAGRSVSTHALKLRLIEEGIFAHRCSWCQLERWRGRLIPLQLDHIDGDRMNNELANIRLLCANCHAQTDTYCGRNIGRR